jgi:hypothetical protein
MIAVKNTDLTISLDQDLVDFVMAGARRWHGERIRERDADGGRKFINFFLHTAKV